MEPTEMPPRTLALISKMGRVESQSHFVEVMSEVGEMELELIDTQKKLAEAQKRQGTTAGLHLWVVVANFRPSRIVITTEGEDAAEAFKKAREYYEKESSPSETVNILEIRYQCQITT